MRVLESLVAKNLANAEDRFLLARLYEVNGDWPKAREAYRDLNLRTKNLSGPGIPQPPSRIPDPVRARPASKSQGEATIRTWPRHNLLSTSSSSFSPTNSAPSFSRWKSIRLATNSTRPLDLIQTSAKRPDLAPIAVRTLADLAEKLGRFDIAEPLYRRYAALPNPRDGAIVQALFLGRHGQVKDALDLCEPLWANPENVETVAAACVEVITSSNDAPDQVQVDRVAGWLEQAIKQKRLRAPAGCTGQLPGTADTL